MRVFQPLAQQLHVDVRAPGDTMTVLHPPRDITPLERIIRWFFSVPQWVQISGAVLVLLAAVVAIVLIWQRRESLVTWVRTRHLTTPLFWKVVVGMLGIVALVTIASGGTAFFFYSQNNNQFCLSCHTLHDEVYQRFQQSKHHRVAELRCHDCHSEPLIAEVRQIGLWMLKRPEDVGPHAPVPRAVCASCHIRANPDSTWERIVATAGHSIHVLSDTAKKRGIDCLTCHGVTAHRFVPVAETCAQSGCHEKAQIRLGRMAGQTSLHCVVCHEFTAPVPETTSVSLARQSLVPSTTNCLGCHEMRQQMASFVPSNDAHKGKCGWCHDPHRQTEPRQAFETCATGSCHARADTLTPMHRGLHRGLLAQCGQCHEAHTWSVRGTACLDCHRNIFNEPPRRVRPPGDVERFLRDVRNPTASRFAPPSPRSPSASAGYSRSATPR